MVAAVGGKADLGFSVKELKEVIENGGGTYSAKIDANVTVLVASENETKKKKAPPKIAAAREVRSCEALFVYSDFVSAAWDQDCDH